MSRSNPMHHSAPMTDLYAEVTQQIIKALEAGTPPWVCPWDPSHGSLLPANLTTGRRYRGVNVMLLNLRQMAAGYPTSRWLTFQQALSVGARVRKGEHGTRIVFFKLLERDNDQEAEGPRAANDEPARRVIPLLKSFTVFNEAQVDDLPPTLTWPEAPERVFTPCEAAEALLQASGADIRHGGARAFYSPTHDFIQMPPRDTFHSEVGYYNTALHELTHWSGHETRCHRPLLGRQHIESYAFEELVAEMGSAFLSSHCGLSGTLHHASYVGEWLQALRNDTRLIFSAASLAQKAADFLIPPEQADTSTQPTEEAA